MDRDKIVGRPLRGKIAVHRLWRLIHDLTGEKKGKRMTCSQNGRGSRRPPLTTKPSESRKEDLGGKTLRVVTGRKEEGVNSLE